MNQGDGDIFLLLGVGGQEGTRNAHMNENAEELSIHLLDVHLSILPLLIKKSLRFPLKGTNLVNNRTLLVNHRIVLDQ
ncbi:hypothetical protein [Viridibacillus arvi]|uniref:hypothetical protein n=1 Tax=Viridibacillus arvi TaxID=263475 RepID=UPI0036EFA5E2